MKTLTTPRPKTSDAEIIRKAAEKLAPEVAEWIGDGTPVEDIIPDLEKAMRWSRDGYKLARELDDYDPDAQLVEILDSAEHYKSQAKEKACEEWVKSEGLEAPEIGSEVIDSAKPEHGVGIVGRNWPDGRSTVSFATLGHVTEGMGCHGLILEWERLEHSFGMNDQMQQPRAGKDV